MKTPIQSLLVKGGTIRGGRGQKGQSQTPDAVTSATEKLETV